MKKKVLVLLATVALLAPLLSACVVPAVTPAPVRTISGLAESTTKIVPGSTVNREFDLDGDGANDYLTTTRLLVAAYTGVIEGTGFGPQALTQDLRSNIVRSSDTRVFWGTVGGSAPGAMSLIVTVVSDRSDPARFVFTTRNTVVEGSGSGGLEGITGYGVIRGEGPPGGPFAATSNWEFRLPASP